MIAEPFIQVAGVIDKKEADMLVECGVDYIGFPLRLNVHKEDLTEDSATKIIRSLPKQVKAILITYLSEPTEIIRFAESLGVTHIQLHGNIELAKLKVIKEMRPDFVIIKSIVIGKEDIDVREYIKEYSRYVSAFITDTFDPKTGASGATGKTHDWRVSREIAEMSPVPVILAGGINSENVQDAISCVGPHGVDSHTGVEGPDGRKDRRLVERFVKKTNDAYNNRCMKSIGTLTIGNLEALYVDTYRGISRVETIKKLTIDLSETTFIEVSSLIRLLWIICSRNNMGLETKIHLPKAKKVRDFLRIWRFPEALYDFTGRNFSYFCITEDRKYFGENSSDDDYYYKSLSKEINHLITNRFFSINTYEVTNDHNSNLSILHRESERWKGNLIGGFLKEKLREKNASDYVPARIVYEAMTNALRHPCSSYIAASSHCDDGYKSGSYVTIVFLDDGLPMNETLKAAIINNVEVRDSVSEDKHFRIKVKLKRNGSTDIEYVNTDADVNGMKADYLLFVACLFPGVSRDLSRSCYYMPEKEMETSPGMGLVALLNCACEVFGGSVSFRMGNLFANVRKNTEGDARYNVSITDYGGLHPKINGNMVTVRLPLEGK